MIVGAGNLGQALANYAGFDERGFPVAAVVDIDPAKVGTTIGNVPVRHIDELPSLVATEAASGSSPRRPGSSGRGGPARRRRRDRHPQLRSPAADRARG